MNYYIEVLKKYAVFTGRAGRREFWMFFLFNIIISIVLSIVGKFLHAEILSTLYALAVLLPGIGVGIRRLHDTGRSGWWLLIGLIPIVGCIILIVFWAKQGDAGTNQYGATPSGQAPAATPAA
jgi:uncharacterized membrane protein YhaH (DUF805 family)